MLLRRPDYRRGINMSKTISLIAAFDITDVSTFIDFSGRNLIILKIQHKNNHEQHLSKSPNIYDLNRSPQSIAIFTELVLQR